MPDVRKEILPAAGWLYNPFFDCAVQSVLERKRTLAAQCPKQAIAFLQAWPLIVFESSCELAHEVSDIERHSGWLWCYRLDRQFSADHLAAITLFVELPRERWDLRRALVEFENQAPTGLGEAMIRGETVDVGGDAGWAEANDQTLWPPLVAWKDVAAYIEMNCPHLKTVWLSGERLRKKEFYAEKRRRQTILDLWHMNFLAMDLYGRTNWYERMPCLPA
jgi:hypothetical protein